MTNTGAPAGDNMTKRHLALADEMFERRARNGQDHPGTWREKSVKQMVDAGLLQKTGRRGTLDLYYFTEAGYQWYLSQRPEKARKNDDTL